MAEFEAAHRDETGDGHQPDEQDLSDQRSGAEEDGELARVSARRADGCVGELREITRARQFPRERQFQRSSSAQSRPSITRS